ncbi:hypothetical protein AMTRI_Chr01g133900 [Amborella trichopoda]|uniref:Pentacotripeptide-repeat region of PRORP domain-containing protein n=1 Tax=Amborella trichopoda TaxID=13333 RepID=W1Q055_AMBTC|nr:pentatricopeptide repeat-containing protein At3g49240 [Amborella trichopoda]ERN14103.1 hypothetical protein AMTR_s00021p00236970 [Amborella trichopoda]|eukprot:XP_006852636.1 pentatricopeptide repeat-containing protein At3g49240 [Amborella trichopoda]
MSLSKYFSLLPQSPVSHRHHLLFLRFLSFSSPEDAAAERRRRKRRLRIEPPLSSSNRSGPRPPISPNANPNAPKLPETTSALTGNRLNLHNKVLSLLRERQFTEAALSVRHHIYSNCRPTIFTCNSVLFSLLNHRLYPDFLSLHRFFTQASIAPNLVTFNLLLQAYCDIRKPETALETYRTMLNSSPFSPSPTTYRILTKGLVDTDRLSRALELLPEMREKGIGADSIVYNNLMLGCVKAGELEKAIEIFGELKQNLKVYDGIVHGTLMKGYFSKGMDKEAMECYESLFNLGFKMNAISYNSVLDALAKNAKFDEAEGLFDRMLNEHDPPRRVTVNLGSFNVMVDGFCSQGKFQEAIDVFRKMSEKMCSPDTLSYNNLIEQLCNNGLLREAEALYNEMAEKSVNPDEFTYVLLVDACFREKKENEAAGYFEKMVETGLKPNVVAYNKVIGGLVNASKIDEATKFFEQMREKELKPDTKTYDFVLRGLCEQSRFDEVLKIVGDVLKNDEVLDTETKEFVFDSLRKVERDGELQNLFDEREREKAEALAKEAEEASKSEEAAKAASEGATIGDGEAKADDAQAVQALSEGEALAVHSEAAYEDMESSSKGPKGDVTSVEGDMVEAKEVGAFAEEGEEGKDSANIEQVGTS